MRRGKWANTDRLVAGNAVAAAAASWYHGRLLMTLLLFCSIPCLEPFIILRYNNARHYARGGT